MRDLVAKILSFLDFLDFFDFSLYQKSIKNFSFQQKINYKLNVLNGSQNSEIQT